MSDEPSKPARPIGGLIYSDNPEHYKRKERREQYNSRCKKLRRLRVGRSYSLEEAAAVLGLSKEGFRINYLHGGGSLGQWKYRPDWLIVLYDTRGRRIGVRREKA